jgi:hypothetical protein
MAPRRAEFGHGCNRGSALWRIERDGSRRIEASRYVATLRLRFEQVSFAVNVGEIVAKARNLGLFSDQPVA